MSIVFLILGAFIAGTSSAAMLLFLGTARRCCHAVITTHHLTVLFCGISPLPSPWYEKNRTFPQTWSESWSRSGSCLPQRVYWRNISHKVWNVVTTYVWYINRKNRIMYKSEMSLRGKVKALAFNAKDAEFVRFASL